MPDDSSHYAVSRGDFLFSAGALAVGTALMRNRPRRAQADSAGGVLGCITVSPSGIANGQSTTANNGAQFGPDTPGTTTQGFQEAVSYAIALATGMTTTGAPPRLYLDAGTFDLSQTITVPVPANVPTNGVGFEIEGSGHLTTRLRFSAGQGIMFGQYGFQDVVIRNLCIENVNGGTTTSLIAMTGSGTALPDLRSEMMFEHVWFECSLTLAGGLPSNGCIYFAPFNGQTGGFDLYFTNCVMAGSFSITSPFNASMANCLVASGRGVTFTTTTQITAFTNCQVYGQVVLSGANRLLKVSSSYWNQIPAEGAVTCAATTGTTRVTVQNSSLNFGSTGAVVTQPAGVVELHYHGNDTYVSGGTYTLVAGGCYLSHTSTCGGNYPDGFYAGPGAGVQGMALPANPPVSGTTYQNAYGIAIGVAVPVTYNPTASQAATCTLYTGPQDGFAGPVSADAHPAGSTPGVTSTLRFRVPAGWHYKIVTTNASIGTATVLPEQ